MTCWLRGYRRSPPASTLASSMRLSQGGPSTPAFCATSLKGSILAAKMANFTRFATHGPMFTNPIAVALGEVVERDGFVFADSSAELLTVVLSARCRRAPRPSGCAISTGWSRCSTPDGSSGSVPKSEVLVAADGFAYSREEITMQKALLRIGGKDVESSDRRTYQKSSGYTREPIAEVADAGPQRRTGRSGRRASGVP